MRVPRLRVNPSGLCRWAETARPQGIAHQASFALCRMSGRLVLSSSSQTTSIALHREMRGHSFDALTRLETSPEIGCTRCASDPIACLYHPDASSCFRFLHGIWRQASDQGQDFFSRRVGNRSSCNGRNVAHTRTYLLSLSRSTLSFLFSLFFPL